MLVKGRLNYINPSINKKSKLINIFVSNQDASFLEVVDGGMRNSGRAHAHPEHP